MRMLLRDLQPSTNYGVQFRTSPGGGQVSDWSGTFLVTTINDTTPPPVPSTPVITPYLGQLKVAWDGLGSAAEAMPNDFSYIEVHASVTTGFTPSSSTLKDSSLQAKGETLVTGFAYDTPVFIKLVSVDLVGNKSAGSAQATATPTRVSGLDVAALAIATTHLGDGAVTAIKIADATITSAKIGTAQILNANIANLAVDDAKIGNVAIGKLTAGSLTADMTVSARIKTANTGARVELNSSGLQAFNTAGTQTVDIAASTGTVTILGNFRTGVAGGALPYMTIDDVSDRTTIAFWNAAGTKNAYINSVAGPTTPQLGANTGIYTIDGVSTSGYNRLFLREGSTQLGIVRGSDQTSYGGTLDLNPTFAKLRWSPLGGAFTGGEFYADTNQAIMTKNTAGVANTAGRVSVDDTSANFVFTDAAGSSTRGIIADANGVSTFGTMFSPLGWSVLTIGTKVDLVEFRLDKWGGGCYVHAYFTTTAAIGAGNIANEVLLDISGTGLLPQSQTSMSCRWNGGLGSVYFDSGGNMVLEYTTDAMAIGTDFRVDGAWFRS